MRRIRITRVEFYAQGGLANPELFRKQRGAGWSYWRAALYS